MDGVRGVDERVDATGDDYGDGAVAERPVEVGNDERRMHVRAYNHWVSLLHGRAYPAIADLDPENIADFGANSVLLDFSGGLDDPAIRFLGTALRTECGVEAHITHVSQVPSRSLLSRLTDHYLQIIANRAPIGFEAEFVSQRGHNTLYRGILMPFSSDENTIDFIYGVINWKELVDAATQAQLHADIAEARRTAPRPTLAAPVWADGPSAGFAASTLPEEPTAEQPAPTADAVAEQPAPAAAEIPEAPAPAAPDPVATEAELLLTEIVEAPAGSDTLGDQLMLARESAAAARASDMRSRAALYRALGRAYDFACAAEAEGDAYAALLADAGIAVQERAPMTPVVKLVFGVDYDKTRLTEFAAVLTHARRNAVVTGGLEALLDSVEGGIKGLVQAERALRSGTPSNRSATRAVARLRKREAIAPVAIPADGREFVVLVARAGADGMLEVVAELADDANLAERVLRRAAA